MSVVTNNTSHNRTIVDRFETGCYTVVNNNNLVEIAISWNGNYVFFMPTDLFDIFYLYDLKFK